MVIFSTLRLKHEFVYLPIEHSSFIESHKISAFLFDLKITDILARLGRFLGTERLDQTDSFS